jgi:hypothetical protein
MSESLLNSSVPNLINGVSQQPPSLKLKTQAILQENGLSSVVTGLSKRPSSELVANLGDLTGADNAFIHNIRRDENEFYTCIITTSQIRVYDEQGVQKTVTNNTGYLSGLTNPREQLAATTIADYTFILNKTKTTAMSTAKSPARGHEALIYVKQGDYQSKFTWKITRAGTTYTRTIETGDSFAGSNTQAIQSEKSIQTDRIAENMLYGNAPDTNIYPASSDTATTYVYGTIPNITFTQYGNVIHVQATDSSDFEIAVEDSRGNNNIFAFKDITSDFKKLPTSGPVGFVIGVTGDNDKGQDDYWVRLAEGATGSQVWKETLEPNINKSFNSTTMPHQLKRNANGTFLFEAAAYKERKVGDDTTNPFPSFIDLPLNDIFFHRNRLGILADENVILSEAGEFTEFNFFKKTTLTLLDTDPIDAAVSNNKVSILKHAVPFNESLLLFSDLTQFRLSASDLLSPETVAINVTTQFETSNKAKPVGAGRYVFFGTDNGDYSGVREYYVDTNADVDDASNITSHVPNYIKGSIKKMEASANEDILLVLSDEDPKAIYVYSYYWQGSDKLQSSWSRWTFEGDVLDVSFSKSVISVLLRYQTATGYEVSLEKIDLAEDTAKEITTKKHGVCLDRRQTWTSANSLVADASPATGATPIYVSEAGATLTSAEAQTHVTNGGTVFFGAPYTFRYQPSNPVMKENNEPILGGRLQLRNMEIIFNDTGYFQAVVTPKGRDTRTNTFTGRVIGSSNNILDAVAIETGSFKFPILAKDSEVEIEIKSDGFLPAVFQGLEWEGYFVMRAKRL